ncbi:hypothetical protein SAMN04487977_104107 [Treponema bryantii]|uniref:Divergent polysaccharide deacetylase n=1 Tax=Treponema bryantii TaxID=163 RepID=A0A1H9FNW0_9SPIR|nr:divergent polysaccharide deacetylase family protein [Treponema bryantii]SEQ39574.1 hypothetical protein SAMN04487977_104107 [Treponema bryantii]
MPQKKTARKTSSKTTRKTGSKRTTRTTRRSSKKPKVYIPAYKAIIFCCAIITICMGLLLVTTLHEPNKKLPDSIIERYKEEIIDSKNNKETEAESAKKKKDENKPKTENKTKADTKPKTESQPKTETKKPETPKKPQSSNKTEPAKTDKSVKIETPQAKDKTPEKDSQNTQKTQDTTTVPAPVTPSSKYNFPKAKNNAQLIFVFDDGGQNLSHLTPFLKLPFPITVAVLPQLAHSKETAAQVRKAGFEVMLHQPMQAVNASVNPGPGAIKPEMSESEIKSVLFQNITEIGPISGMNNHEGSAITADAEKMATVMQFCSQEGIYFLDSRTNVETKVPYVAGELGYSYYERNIFLDNEKTNENALKELKKGLDLANKNGSVIMIGHIWSADFLPAFLQDAYPELKAQGYTFSTVSKSRARKN